MSDSNKVDAGHEDVQQRVYGRGQYGQAAGKKTGEEFQNCQAECG
jgi:hypothetical protein